ncbi:MAG: hypothetical protein AAF415_00360 [Pseudomonadota bacterium]
MKRWLFSLSGLVLVAAAVGWLWWINPPEAMASRFGADQCQRIQVFAAERPGTAVVGIEDIAVLDDRTLVLSAHDRFDPSQPNGGLYRLGLDTVADGQARVTEFLPADLFDGELRPHGIALSPDKQRIAVVNRLRNGKVALEFIEAIGSDRARRQRSVNDAFCRANDVVVLDDETAAVTLDRRACDPAPDDLLGLWPTGRIVLVSLATGAPIRSSEALAFPNGITQTWVAETRAGRLTAWAGPQSVNGRLADPIALPGGPDNLTRDDAGDLVVALHPSLLRLAPYRFGWIDHAPSRIARVDPETREVEILFDDPTGTLFSAATTGVLTGGRLIAGSMRDSGLLICEPA